jgi:HEAT repeat protein
MKKYLLTGLAVASTALTDVSAHGGVYRGPGDVVPPNPGGGRGTAGAPGGGAPGPNTPGGGAPGPLTGPAVPGAGTGGLGPANAPRGATTPRGGAEIGDDFTRWSFWWEFNKDRFINLRDALALGGPATRSEEIYYGGALRESGSETMRPTRSQIVADVLPALHRALASTTNRDITTACMVAMAKIGADHPTFKVLPLLEERLRDKDQEIRETAAIAMGISQMPEALPTLLELIADTPRAREIADRSEIDVRTRTFAAYGVGLIAHASSRHDLKTAVFRSLRAEFEKTSDRNLKIGTIHAMRLIRIGNASEAEQELRSELIDVLWNYYTKPLGPSDQQIQAHVPAVVAAVLGRSDDASKYKTRLLDELAEKFGKRSISAYQSATLALGQLCGPGPEDAAARRALSAYVADGRDQQTRHFAMIAMAQIGGDENRTALLQHLAKGTDQERSWAALALGVMAFEAYGRAGKEATPDATVGRALLDVLRTEKNPEVTTAVAIGLGLCRWLDAAPELRKLLQKYRKDDDRAGYFSLGLALMHDHESKDLLRDIVKTSSRRPALIRQAAVALGKLGDQAIAEDLLTILNDGAPNVAKLSAVASALSFIGDRRSIKPLTNMLFDTSITELSRAFVAAALGGIADKESLPWNAKIGANINYRAAVETLTNQNSGILDIL